MAKQGQAGAQEPPREPANIDPLPLEDLAESEKYPPAVRVALIVGLPLTLWVLIGAGAVWLLHSLWGRVVGIIVMGAIAIAAILLTGGRDAANRASRRRGGR